MKALFSFLSCLIMLALFTRCADDELDGPSDGLPDKGLVVRLSTGGGLETKTTLNSTGAYHHVQEVWAVLYKLDASATDPTNNENYDFVTAEKLDWNPSKPAPDRSEYPSEEAYRAAYEQYVLETGGAYGNGSPQQKDFELHSDENGTLLDAGIYRVLCVGLDDMSGTVYNLKTGDQLNEEIFATGKTLADAVATITNIENAFEGELFAGWAEFQFEPDNLNIVEVEMKRRVAGVLCYVTDIPKVITTDGEKPVKGIRLALYTGENVSEDSSKKGLNNQIHLCRLEGEKRTQDFGTLTNDASWSAPDEDGYTTLAYYALPNQSGDNADTYQFDWEAEGVSLKNNSLLMGAYVIPIKKGAEPTLVVQLIGGDNGSYAEGDSPQEVEVNGTVLATFNATRSGVEGGDVTSYAILPNYIYHIGNKPEPDGTDKDEPVSLLGQKITVTPEPWEDRYEINVEYPSVPIMPRLSVINQVGSTYDLDKKFDCIGIADKDYDNFFPVKDRIKLLIEPSVLKSRWKISIVSNNMLYLNVNGSYEDSYAPTDPNIWGTKTTIDMVLMDYVDRNQPSDAYRTATIYLYTYADDKSETPINTQHIEIMQYNAIIVTTDDNRILGFSHYDWSSDRSQLEYKDGEQSPWNYRGAYPGNIFGASLQGYGIDNYKNAKRKADDKGDDLVDIYHLYENFYEYNNGSAIYKTGKPKVSIDSNYKPDTYEGVYWFLPSADEIYPFFEQAMNAEDGYNLKKPNERYWTSSPVRQLDEWSSNIFYDSNGDIQTDDETNRDNYYYMRQCCLIYDPTGN